MHAHEKTKRCIKVMTLRAVAVAAVVVLLDMLKFICVISFCSAGVVLLLVFVFSATAEQLSTPLQ